MPVEYERIRWASADHTDSGNGLSNKIQPPTGIKNTGLVRSQSISRQMLNWQFNEYGLALQDLQQQFDAGDELARANQIRLNAIDDEDGGVGSITALAGSLASVITDYQSGDAVLQGNIDSEGQRITALLTDRITPLEVTAAAVNHVTTGFVASDVLLQDQIDTLAGRITVVDDPNSGVNQDLQAQVNQNESDIVSLETTTTTFINSTYASDLNTTALDLAAIQANLSALGTTVSTNLVNTNNAITELPQQIYQHLYQIGDIWTTKSLEHPSIRFGFGTWQQIIGRFLLGEDTTDPRMTTVGQQGGQIGHSHSDTFVVEGTRLTEAEIPTHNHGYRDRYHPESQTGNGTDNSNEELMPDGFNPTGNLGTDADNDSWLYYDATTEETGGSELHGHNLGGGVQAIEVLPPYEVVRFWERVA